MPEPIDELPEGVELTAFDDHHALRRNIFDGIQKEFSSVFPQTYGGVRMELKDPHYEDPEHFSIKEQKDALLKDKFLSRRLRGTIQLFDDKTGEKLDEQKTTLLRVPYLTERGSFIHNGSEYSSIMQSRLVPGAYTRRQSNGGIETQFNTRSGTGTAFRVGFEPETSQYKLRVQQANLHLYSILHDLGVPDDHLEKVWGADILENNRHKYDARVFDKAYARFVPKRQQTPEAEREAKVVQLKTALDAAKVDGGVLKTTLPNFFDMNKAASWAAAGMRIKIASRFEKESNFAYDYTPDELREHKNDIIGKVGPRLAGMREWPRHWHPEASGHWLTWFDGYFHGTRTDDDKKQIARWANYKRLMGAKFKNKPTPRLALCLKAWAINPLLLLPEDKREAMAKAMQDYRDEKFEEHDKRASTPRIVIVGGLHGDELAACATIKKLKKLYEGDANVKVIDCGNDTGERKMGGKDLNRHFGKDETPLNTKVQDAIATWRPEFLIDIHEDTEHTKGCAYASPGAAKVARSMLDYVMGNHFDLSSDADGKSAEITTPEDRTKKRDVERDGMICPACHEHPGRVMVQGDALRCEACGKTTDMEEWEKSAAWLGKPDYIRKAILEASRTGDYRQLSRWGTKGGNAVKTITPKATPASALPNDFMATLRRLFPAYEASPDAQHVLSHVKDASEHPDLIARQSVLLKLLEAKRLSDQKRYAEKAKIMREIMTEHPEDFVMDQDGDMAGINHVSTGFQIHAPRNIVPPEVAISPLTKQWQADHDKSASDNTGWYGVDLDRTLAFRPDNLKGIPFIGKPITAMKKRVLAWITQGITVKIFTARAAGGADTGYIAEWLKRNGFPALEITAEKDQHCRRLYDDIAVQVKPNTGELVKDAALKGLALDSLKLPLGTISDSVLGYVAKGVPAHKALSFAGDMAKDSEWSKWLGDLVTAHPEFKLWHPRVGSALPSDVSELAAFEVAGHHTAVKNVISPGLWHDVHGLLVKPRVSVANPSRAECITPTWTPPVMDSFPWVKSAAVLPQTRDWTPQENMEGDPDFTGKDHDYVNEDTAYGLENGMEIRPNPARIAAARHLMEGSRDTQLAIMIKLWEEGHGVLPSPERAAKFRRAKGTSELNKDAFSLAAKAIGSMGSKAIGAMAPKALGVASKIGQTFRPAMNSLSAAGERASTRIADWAGAPPAVRPPTLPGSVPPPAMRPPVMSGSVPPLPPVTPAPMTTPFNHGRGSLERSGRASDAFLYGQGMNPEGGIYKSLPGDQAQHFATHGIAKGTSEQQATTLHGILNNGFDSTKPLYTAPFNVPDELKAGLGSALGTSGGSAYKDGLATLVAERGKPLTNDTLRHVFINDAYAHPDTLSSLRQQYAGRNINFDLLSNHARVMGGLK